MESMENLGDSIGKVLDVLRPISTMARKKRTVKQRRLSPIEFSQDTYHAAASPALRYCLERNGLADVSNMDGDILHAVRRGRRASDGEVSYSPSRFDEHSDSGEVFASQLDWCVEELESTKTKLQSLSFRSTGQLETFVQNQKLHPEFEKLGVEQGLIVKWMEHTYTEFLAEEQMRLSQRAIQRQLEMEMRRQRRTMSLPNVSVSDEQGSLIMFQTNKSHDDFELSHESMPRTITLMDEKLSDKSTLNFPSSRMSAVSDPGNGGMFTGPPDTESGTKPRRSSGSGVHFSDPLETLLQTSGIEFRNPKTRKETFEILEDINSWDMDIFGIASLNAASPMAMISMKIFFERNLFTRLNLNIKTVLTFFVKVDNKYNKYPSTPYHNDLHGADVMHSVHYCLNAPVLRNSFSDIEIFATLIAAAVHDVDHPGHTNNFLVKTEHDLAILYNDISVLENHHISTAFKIMREEDSNILASFSKDDRLTIRKIIIDTVLSTDMSKHTHFLGEFKALTEKTYASQSHDNFDESVQNILGPSYENRVLVLCTIVHSADLGNCAKEWNTCKQWTYRLMEEFWAEGDKELELGLEIGALNNRNVIEVPKAQIGFLNYITIPLWQAWQNYVSPNQDTIQIQRLRQNLENWQGMLSEESSTV
eukprot:m.190192 g.190192  ORF g.190192 m.190192 type:complete len:648 (+) comp15638_c0_seq9:126-2069(+)